jgi:hypothetical protein
MDPVEAKANFSRVCQLLIDKGGDALRAALHAKHPPSTLAADLNSHKKTLQRIRYSVIKDPQWQLLFPTSGVADSNNFDITLLTILLRNICGMSPPATGWNHIPPASDTSKSADIVRIKLYRNDVYGHIPSAQYDNVKFETLWQEISKPLVKLGIPQQDIDELKEAPLSFEEESYIDKLKELKEQEDDLFEKLKDVERKVDNVDEKIAKLQKTVETETLNFSNVNQLAKFDFTGKIDGLCKKFQDGTRDWFFEKLSSWFSDEESRVMILTAGPGVGKSVLSAKACELYKQRGELASYHFCDYRNSDYSNPHRILQSLASQMCDNVAGFRDKLAEVLHREHSRDSLSEAFRVLLKDPLHALGKREPMLIVVDALDESKTNDKCEFLELISDEFPELPQWIKILISTRPELQVREKLRHFKPFEISPNDDNHNLDLGHFIRNCLTNLAERNVSLLCKKCEGSFLYAYFLVHELKEIDLGIEPNLSDFAPKGISGFYEKQFERLKTGLQRFKPGIFRSFVNVVAAARAPLPFKILLTCMDVTDEIYEIRKAISDIMSEVLPVYNECLTVYHKSLTDWLTLDGYEEHAFVANVADGTRRLWLACEGIYSDINLLKSVYDFEFSAEQKFALHNGAVYLVNDGDTQDFHWLVNVKLNFLKLKFFRDLNVDFCYILNKIDRSKLSDHLYWEIFQHHIILKSLLNHGDEKTKCHIYLQSLANGYFNFMQNSNSCKIAARGILDKTKQIWMEDYANAKNTKYKSISMNTVFGRRLKCMALSPDHKLLVCLLEQRIAVFQLPCLTMIFELEINWTENSKFLTFAPDSSYFLPSSIRFSVCFREQKEVPFISHGPANILSCSFSSCGMKLVTSDDDFVKVWGVRKKDLLVKVEVQFYNVYDCVFSSCNAYIVERVRYRHPQFFHKSPNLDTFFIWDSKTLEKQDNGNNCVDACLTNDTIQTISLPSSFSDSNISIATSTRHLHLPNSEMVLITNKQCSEPFTWNGRKCVLLSSSLPFVVYDVIKQEVVDTFRIDCLPCGSRIMWVSKLDGTDFLICFNNNELILLSFESNHTTEFLVHPFVSNADIICHTLSADNLYIAYCYEKCIVIRSVDGNLMQIVGLNQPPVACWWSELYLWIVSGGGVVVKYPCDSTCRIVLGNNEEECTIKFDFVLKFAEGVLVIKLEDEISILKICDNKLCPQQIPDHHFCARNVAISADGCAVLLYDPGLLSSGESQVWEIACENKWELISSKGFIFDEDDGYWDYVENSWLFLAGTQNSRRSVWLAYAKDLFLSPCDNDNSLCLSFIDISSETETSREISIDCVSGIVYLPPDFLIIHEHVWMHLVNVSEGKIIAKLYLGKQDIYQTEILSYFASRDALLFLLKNDIKYFKIHNFENCLKPSSS